MAVEGQPTPPAQPTKKEKRLLTRGKVHIHASFNNTVITFTDQAGNVIVWGSCGTAGFKGSRKSTPYAAQVAAQNATKQAMGLGMREVNAFLKGPGPGREAALRAIQSMGMKLLSITDVTPIPHNGCRPPKRRRV